MRCETMKDAINEVEFIAANGYVKLHQQLGKDVPSHTANGYFIGHDITNVVVVKPTELRLRVENKVDGTLQVFVLK